MADKSQHREPPEFTCRDAYCDSVFKHQHYAKGLCKECWGKLYREKNRERIARDQKDRRRRPLETIGERLRYNELRREEILKEVRTRFLTEKDLENYKKKWKHEREEREREARDVPEKTK